MSTRNLFGSLFTAAAVVVCLAVCSHPAGAFQQGKQQFKEDRDIKEPDAKMVRAYGGMVRNGSISDNIFDQVLGYKLNSFSFPENRGQMPKLRQSLIRELQSAGLADDQSAHKRMRTKVLQVMTNMIGKEYHPFVRVNAMLVLGDLNQQEPPRAFNAPPVPDPEALKVMLQAVEDPAQIDAVRAAALIGIGRHADLGISDEALLRRVRQAAVKLSGPDQFPWLRRQAIEVIGNLGEMGREGEMAQLLMKLIADTNENLSIRSQAAHAFGSLDFAKGPRINYKLAAQMLAKLTVDAIAKANPTGNDWTQSQIEGLQTNLALIEIGIKGRPDPNHRYTPTNPEPPPTTGMLLVLGEASEERKPVNEVIAKFNELLDTVFNDKEVDSKEIDYMRTQFEDWLKANPIEDRALLAGKDPLPG